jgi:hypothetical protein
VIKDDDGSTGTAANRFGLSGDISLTPDQSIIFQYDSTTSRCRAFGSSTAGVGAGDVFTGSANNMGDFDTSFKDNRLRYRTLLIRLDIH